MTATNTPTPSKNRSPLVWKGEAVTTTEQLAAFYGVGQRILKRNHQRNRSRFENGKHCYTLTGQALRDFKRDTSNCRLVAPNLNSLTLWTRRGAARHAKMLNSDKAWEVFEQLEDSYFAAPPAPDGDAPAPRKTLTLPEGEHLGEAFVAACLYRCPGAELGWMALRKAADAWTRRTGRPPLADGTLFEVLDRAAIGKVGTTPRSTWYGLGIVQPAPAPVPAVVTEPPVPAALPVPDDWDICALFTRAKDLRGAVEALPDLADRVAAELAVIERALRTREALPGETGLRIRTAAAILGLDMTLCGRLDQMAQGKAIT